LVDGRGSSESTRLVPTTLQRERRWGRAEPSICQREIARGRERQKKEASNRVTERGIRPEQCGGRVIVGHSTSV